MTIKELSRRRFIKSATGLLLVPAFQIVTRATNFLARPAAGGSASCPTDGSPDVEATQRDDDSNRVSETADRFYVGQKNFSHSLGTNKEVCTIHFYMTVFSGTISGKFYRAAIWSISGDNLGSIITNGISDQITGITTDGEKYYHWSGSKPVMVSGTSYHITVGSYQSGITTIAAADLANRAGVWASTPSSINGNSAVWGNTGAIDVDSATYDANIGVYWYD